MKEYKIMSYNIQSCRDYITREFTPNSVANVINKYNPDIVGLNEVRSEAIKPTNHPSWFDQVGTLSKLTNMPYFYFGKAITFEGPYGNAILSKYPLNNIKTIPIPDPIIKDEDAYYESRNIISCECENFHILITHIGLAKSEQRNAIEKLLELINDISKPIILMGDFNMTPDNPLIKEISNKLIDTSIKFNKSLLSFPSINPRIKIDYIFISNDIELINADIPQDVASDHFPYLAKIKI